MATLDKNIDLFDVFHMKPLKIENEVDSNMKSTIRYTFVAPGAIGKGRGRGLKSLGEKGNLPSKSILPQSSDLVKKYIKEIETNYIGKGQGQGLKNSTMSTSQGIQMMHKNSMTFEKENMQINTSSPTSTNQVKKLKQGLEKRTGSLSSTLGISKYEVGSFNKSVVFSNVTPPKCNKSSSTMPSSHEM
ncbi:hypothetical protein H5410_056395 [Solanum commersonii]|uniref:Uncharacterized protein n=1 Tax=Solanum commersonii TaxID=4109 RepID=A0A9J5WLK8_SOLCO|nr:hypothetical protein H5410_056395 [Solanum commersonii]